MLGHRHDRVSPRTRRHWLHGYTMMELIAATAIFVTSVGLLASTTTTALSTRLNLSRAATLDATLNRVLEVAASAPWGELVANTFTPPSPCPGAPLESGTLATSCVTLNGRTVTVTWAVTTSVEAANVDGIAQGSADALVLTATAERANGSLAQLSRTVLSPTSGFRVAPGGALADGVLRVQLTGSWATLDSPLLLLASDNTTVVASTRVGAAGTAVMRAPAASCSKLAPCRVALGTGTSRGMTDTHSLDAWSLLSDNGEVVLTSGRATQASAHVYRRGVLDIYLQAINTTGGKRLTNTLTLNGTSSTAIPAPQAGSVCLWAGFSDGLADQEVPACNTTEDGRAVTFSTYRPDPTGNPLLELAVPTGDPISIIQDSSDPTCPVVPGQLYHVSVGGVGTWLPVATTGVCSTWTWGRPTSLVTTTGTSSTFPSARVTLTPGGHTTAVATWTEGDTARPAAGIPGTADLVWSKPRAASACPGMPGQCAPSWLASPAATSPELSDCPTTACKSPSNSAPYLRYLTPSSGSPRTWPYALAVQAATTTTFSTTVADAESQNVTVTLPSTPTASAGTLSVCTPGCAPVTGLTSVTVASGQSINWQWAAGISAAGSSVALRLTDASGSARTEYLHLPRAAGAPTAAFAMRTIGAQGTATADRAWVWDDKGDALSGATVTWASCASGSTSVAGSTAADGSAIGTWNIESASAATTSGCSLTVSKNGVTVSTGSAFSRTVIAAPGSVVVEAAQSTQGLPTVVSVSVKDKSSARAALAGRNVAVSAETASGKPAQSVWASPAWCVTGLDGRCTITFQVGTDTTANTWVARARAGALSATATSSVVRKVARITMSPLTLQAGSTATATIFTADGAGRALGNKPVTLTAPSGITLGTFSGTTDASGKLSVSISATSAVSIGDKVLTAVSGATNAELIVTTLPMPQRLDVSDTAVTVSRGATIDVPLTVSSLSGNGVVGAVVTVTGGDDGLKVTPRLTTNTAGVAILRLHAEPTATLLTRSIIITVGALSQTVQVRIA